MGNNEAYASTSRRVDMNIIKTFTRPIKKRLHIRRLGIDHPKLQKKELPELAFQIEWAKQFSRPEVDFPRY